MVHHGGVQLVPSANQIPYLKKQNCGKHDKLWRGCVGVPSAPILPNELTGDAQTPATPVSSMQAPTPLPQHPPPLPYRHHPRLLSWRREVGEVLRWTRPPPVLLRADLLKLREITTDSISQMDRRQI